MVAFKHVLVPVDFSPSSDHALELGLDIARANDAQLTLVHVAYTPPTYYAAAAEGFVPYVDLEQEGRELLDELVAKTKETYPKVAGVLASGQPWRKIIDAVRTSEADLVVMGTHGRTGVVRALLGSVAEKVVRTAPVPVLTACLPNAAALRTRTLEGKPAEKNEASLTATGH